jgi:8-oxo-dGTP diphosphatase
MAEANEPPHEAARRELFEELGLTITVGRLLVLDWVPPHGPWDDLLAFIFDGGTIAAGEVERLVPLDDELASIELCSADLAQERLRPYVWRRLAAALDALQDGHPRYAVDGVPVG